MASAFFAGFADTLKDIRLDDRKRERDLEDADAIERLKKKYQAEIVKDYKIIGSDEVRYNAYGDEIGRRTLSAEELAERKAEQEKRLADATAATATAGIRTKELGSFDEDKKLTRQQIQHGMDQESIRTRNDSIRTGNDTTRANAVASGKTGNDYLNKQIDAVRRQIAFVGSDGINSAESRLEAFEAELAAAIDAGDEQAIRRLLSVTAGGLDESALRLKASASKPPAARFSLDTE